jgi:hypothetical protein
MQATRPLLFKGFIGRSIDEFKRLSHIGMQWQLVLALALALRRC